MERIKVPTVQEVLEQFRQDVVASLRNAGFRPPEKAEVPGNCYDAVVAWARLQHRRINKAPRSVKTSRDLQQLTLAPDTQRSLDHVRAEIERGDDLTHRLTRQFYKADFNDFLFNNFGIHHVHLGASGAGVDNTKRHIMSGGGAAVLFVIVEPREAFFLNVLSHDTFESPEMSKSLVRVALRNWPELLKPNVVPGMVSSEMTFEDAFRMQKSGFSVLFDVDGLIFTRGGSAFDGKRMGSRRATSTSSAVIHTANHILNTIVSLVEFVAREVDTVADLTESKTGTRPTEFRLEVIQAGNIAIIREASTGMQFFHDGQYYGVT